MKIINIGNRIKPSKLDRIESFNSLLTGLLMIFLTFIIVGIMILIIDKNPIVAFRALIDGAFGNRSAIIHTIVKSIPVALCSLAVLFSIKGGTFNIGAEGQLVMGAIASTAAGIYLGFLPPVLHIIVCILSGMIVGMLWCIIPAILYIKKGISLLVIFLLLNSIAIFLLQFFVLSVLGNPNSLMPSSYTIAKSARLPNLISGPVNLSVAFILVLVLAVILYLVLKKTKFGYELLATGYNRNAARVSGIKINKYLFLSLVLGGLFAGLAGSLDVIGNHYALYTDFSPGFGYDGIPVALLAGGNPLFAVLGSIFFGALRSGSINMRAMSGVSDEIVNIIQGLLIMMIGTKQLFKYIIAKSTSKRKKV
jgi:simple sugar transport system permease protein